MRCFECLSLKRFLVKENSLESKTGQVETAFESLARRNRISSNKMETGVFLGKLRVWPRMRGNFGFSLFFFCLNSGNKESKSAQLKTRSNSIPAHVGETVTKQPLPVTSATGPTSTALPTSEPGDISLPSHDRLNKLFERLERGDVERLQDIGKAVKSFDR